MNADATSAPRLHLLLAHAVTAYDRKQETKKGHNPYAIAHYLHAVDDAVALIEKGSTVRAALLATFNDRLLDVALKAVGEAPFTRDERR